MACGTLVIGTNVDAIPEVVGTNQNDSGGFVLNDNTPQDVVSCLKVIHVDSDHSLRKQCVLRAQVLFDEQRQWRDMDALIQRMIVSG